MRVHQKFCLKSWYILVLPGCIDNLDRCASSRICLRSWWFLGKTIRPLNDRIPLWSTWKDLYFSSPWAYCCLMILTPSSCSCAIMILSW
jgi:hypothetical protein